MQGASPLASPRLNPGGAGAGGAILRQAGGRAGRGRFVTGQARTPDCISNSFGKSSWGFGGFFQEAPERFPAMVPGGKSLSRGTRERRITSAIHSGKVLGGLGASFKKPPNASLPWCPAGTVCHGAGANAGLHQQFIREKFLGVWGLLSRSPRTLPCHGARRGRFVMGRARTPDCTSNSFGKSSWGFGGFFQEAPNVSSFLRVFFVIHHLRSADSMT